MFPNPDTVLKDIKASDATIEDNVLADLQDQSVQARARKSPWDSSSAPGIGPGFEGAWWGGGTLFGNLQQAADEIVQWGYYPQRRDRELRNFWKTEAILAGGIYSFSARISALPAKIKGPPRNKRKATEMLHALDLQKIVIDMLTTDNGFFIERVGPGRPDKPLNPKLVSYLSAMDSQQIWRTFDPEYPCIYINPYTGQYHKMHYSRIITGSSCPQPDELARGIGFCATSRALRFSQIERDISIFKHEKVGGRFTRALGTLSGLTVSQFNQSIDASKEVDDANGFTRYRGIPWLVAVNQEIKASLIDLAHLPDGFDAEKDTETYVKVLALAFGTDVREFWPSGGSGSTKADATVQHEKARGKGIADVTSTVERVLNWGVLDALDCEVEFDYTDDAEQMATAQYHFQIITNVSTMQQAGNISTKQGTALLVNAGVIDPEVIQNVQDAESAEPADTESPYSVEDIPVQETAQQPQQQPGQAKLAKPPAAQNATSPTPPGGIKPPPPQLNSPRMQTSDMRPAKKETGFKYSADQPRADNGQFGSGNGGSAASKPARDYSKMSEAASQKVTDRASKQHLTKLNPDERRTVRNFSEAGNYGVNEGLRSGSELTGEQSAQVGNMDSAIAKGALDENTTLYRGIETLPGGWKEGTEFQDNGFVSTTLREDVANSFAFKNGTVVKINAPAGTHAMHMSSLSKHSSEQEVLLGRGHTYRVTGISKSGGRNIVNVDIVK